MRIPRVVAIATVAAAMAWGCGTSDDPALDTTTTTVAVIKSTTTKVTIKRTTTSSSTSTSSTSTSTSSTTSTSLPDSPGEISAPQGLQYLADFTPVDESTYEYRTGQANIAGTTYTRSVTIDPQRESVGFVEYDLGKKYGKLSGMLGLRDDVPADTTMQIEVFGDGRPLFNQTLRLGDAVPLDLDLTGVLRLRLQVSDMSGDHPYDVFAVFGDAAVAPATP